MKKQKIDSMPAARDLIAMIEAQRQTLIVQSFADLLKVSHKVLYRQIKSGSFPAIRLKSEIRIHPKAAAAWLRSRLTVPEVA
jgi:predicted DNA-binding transcriptional regulator AlpA